MRLLSETDEEEAYQKKEKKRTDTGKNSERRKRGETRQAKTAGRRAETTEEK